MSTLNPEHDRFHNPQTQSTFLPSSINSGTQHHPQAQSLIVEGNRSGGLNRMSKSRYANKFSFKNRPNAQTRSIYIDRSSNRSLNKAEAIAKNGALIGKDSNKVDQWSSGDLQRELDLCQARNRQQEEIIRRVRARAAEARQGWENCSGKCIRFVNGLAEVHNITLEGEPGL